MLSDNGDIIKMDLGDGVETANGTSPNGKVANGIASNGHAANGSTPSIDSAPVQNGWSTDGLATSVKTDEVRLYECEKAEESKEEFKPIQPSE